MQASCLRNYKLRVRAAVYRQRLAVRVVCREVIDIPPPVLLLVGTRCYHRKHDRCRIGLDGRQANLDVHAVVHDILEIDGDVIRRLCHAIHGTQQHQRETFHVQNYDRTGSWTERQAATGVWLKRATTASVGDHIGSPYRSNTRFSSIGVAPQVCAACRTCDRSTLAVSVCLRRRSALSRTFFMVCSREMNSCRCAL